MRTQYSQTAHTGQPTPTWPASQTATILTSGAPVSGSLRNSHPPNPLAPLCEGAFFFRVKVRYWVEKVRKILKTQAQCVIMVGGEKCCGAPVVQVARETCYDLWRGGKTYGAKGRCSLWFTVISIGLAIIFWFVFKLPSVILTRIGTFLELIAAFLVAPELLGAERIARIEESARAVADWLWDRTPQVARRALFVAPGAIGFPLRATLLYILVGGAIWLVDVWRSSVPDLDPDHDTDRSGCPYRRPPAYTNRLEKMADHRSEHNLCIIVC